MAHDFEGVGDVEDVGLAARPAAAGVEVDGPALIDEAPADDVRLLAVATGGKALGVARGRAGLADLVHVGHAVQDGFAFAAEVHHVFAAAERGLRLTQEGEDQLLRLGRMDCAIGLLLMPKLACPKKGKPQKESAQSRCCRCRVLRPALPCGVALPASRPGVAAGSGIGERRCPRPPA